MSHFAIASSLLLLLLGGTSARAADASVEVLTDPGVAARGGHDGANALWGGRIIDTTTDAGQACIEVAAYPLRKGDGRPQTSDVRREGQHFLACQTSAFDATYTIGNQATVTGVVGAVRLRDVAGKCKYVTDSRGRRDTVSYRTETSTGCALHIPSLSITDSRSWPEPPTRTGAPTM